MTARGVPGARAVRRARLVAAGLAAALVLGACGAEPGPDAGPRDTPPSDEGFAGFPACDDVQPITAAPALYRDEPRYGNAQGLVEEVGEWARSREGFVELWLDREHHGWVTAGVHGDADVAALQDEAAGRWPDEGVVVVGVPYTLDELRDVHERVLDALWEVDADPKAGSGLRVSTGVVTLYGVPATPEAEAVLADFVGEPLCVDVVDTAEIVPEGEQPDGGDGWRLLGHEAGAGEAYRTGLATTDEQLAALWEDSGLPGTAPEVDWEHEVAVWFGEVFGSSCPIRLDDVLVTDGVLHSETVVPGAGPALCTADANPHSYVVAVQRSLLPGGPLLVQLGPGEPQHGAAFDARTVVDVDLSVPGSTATDAQIRRDERPPADAPLAMVEDGDALPDSGARYVWHERPDCNRVVLGPLDGTLWRLADREPDWTVPDGTEVLLHPPGDHLVVSTSSMEYFFVRAPDGICGE